MDEYWLISLPQNNMVCKSGSHIVDSIKDYGTTLTLTLPEFKFGGIDEMIKYSDDCIRLTVNLEAVITSLVNHINSLLDQDEELASYLQVNGCSVTEYLQKFQWDYLKYSTKKKPLSILSDVSEQFMMIYEEIKQKTAEHNALKIEVEKIEAKHTGSLLARDLSDFVKKEDILMGSKFLQTLLILVPTIDIENWKNYYEHLWHGIVPGSSKLLFSDHDFGLFSVVLTKNTVEDFKAFSLKSRIIVRKFEYNESEINYAKTIECKKKMQLVVNKRNLQFWLTKHFSLCFSMYFHIEFLSVINDSILKYGLKTPFKILLIKPKLKYAGKIRRILNNLCHNLDQDAFLKAQSQPDKDIWFYPHGEKEYYPYINCCVFSAGTQSKTKIPLFGSIKK